MLRAWPMRDARDDVCTTRPLLSRTAGSSACVSAKWPCAEQKRRQRREEARHMLQRGALLSQEI